MSNKKHYSIRVTISIQDADVSYGPALADLSLSESVPSGTDPVQFLRQSINREFKRKFADLQLPFDEEIISE